MKNGNPVLKVQQSGKGRKNKKLKEAVPPAPPTPKATPKPKAAKVPAVQEDAPVAAERSASTRRSWISRWFRWSADDSAASDRSRPPSSGRLDWVIVDDWSDEKDKLIKSGLDKGSKNSAEDSTVASPDAAQGDGFQIGVQDWRDPDLVVTSSDGGTSTPSKDTGKSDGDGQSSNPGASAKQAGKPGSSGAPADANGPKGGSITPGSGEYVPEAVTDPKTSGTGKSDASSGSQGGLMSKIFGDDDGADSTTHESSASATIPTLSYPPGDDDGPGDHEGLWVTITPASSASPFFDTLLVLVISPLITLTVVYSLLMLRAKIRRRRWRAPKSVVERLPVRTYHTVAPSPTHTPRNPSPTSSSPTTPLLQGLSRPRPRSRTTTGIPEPGDLLRVDSGGLQAPKPQPHEKGTPHISSEWKKHMGRQVECVVCLEEYVDGVSRVMSLPCGHEFHVECITPWLTTRRRTCPICKGDVVRSLARGSPSSPRYEPYRDDSDDDVEASGSGVNQPPADRSSDVEQGGILLPAPRRGIRMNPNEWFSILSSSLGSSSAFRARREEVEDDRNR